MQAERTTKKTTGSIIAALSLCAILVFTFVIVPSALAAEPEPGDVEVVAADPAPAEDTPAVTTAGYGGDEDVPEAEGECDGSFILNVDETEGSSSIMVTSDTNDINVISKEEAIEAYKKLIADGVCTFEINQNGVITLVDPDDMEFEAWIIYTSDPVTPPVWYISAKYSVKDENGLEIISVTGNILNALTGELVDGEITGLSVEFSPNDEGGMLECAYEPAVAA